MFYFLYKLIQNLSRNLINYYQIKFDLLTLIDFKLDSFYINLSTVVLLSILSIIAGLIVIYFAKKISEESTKIKFSYVFYMMIYWALFGFWWFISGVHKLSGRKVKWGKTV